MQIFKFRRRSCKLPLLFPPRRQSVPRTCSQAVLYCVDRSRNWCGFVFWFHAAPFVTWSYWWESKALELKKGKKKRVDCYSKEYRNTWNTCIPVKLTSLIFPPFLGKQKEKSSNLYLSAWRFQEYVLRNSFIHSFILITQETPKTNVFVIRPRAEAAKWVFSYRGMSCRMAFESKLKDE